MPLYMPEGPDIHIEHPGPHSVKSLLYGDIPGGCYTGGLCALPGCLPCGDDRGAERGWEAAGVSLFLRHEQCGGDGVRGVWVHFRGQAGATAKRI